MAFASLLPSPDITAFAVGLLVIFLGLVISWRAYQGFRRNESRPMLLLAVGMLLITVVPTVTEIIVVPWFVARYTSPGTGAVSLTMIVSRTCEAIGIGILLYSLRSRQA